MVINSTWLFLEELDLLVCLSLVLQYRIHVLISIQPIILPIQANFCSVKCRYLFGLVKLISYSHGHCRCLVVLRTLYLGYFIIPFHESNCVKKALQLNINGYYF